MKILYLWLLPNLTEWIWPLISMNDLDLMVTLTLSKLIWTWFHSKLVIFQPEFGDQTSQSPYFTLGRKGGGVRSSPMNGWLHGSWPEYLRLDLQVVSGFSVPVGGGVNFGGPRGEGVLVTIQFLLIRRALRGDTVLLLNRF